MTLLALAEREEIDPAIPARAVKQYRIDDPTAGASGNEGGDA